jgi:two-component system cell cycle response regulator DivK
MDRLVRVLIIEDNAVTRKVISEVLKNYSFEIIEAENGRAGIESAVNLEPDLILLDLNLPDISGFEVLDALKRNPRTMLIPVMVITVSATSQDVQKAILYGVRNYVVKPINPEDLIMRISKVLSIPIDELKRRKGGSSINLYPGIDFEQFKDLTEYMGYKIKKVSVAELVEGMKIGVPLLKSDRKELLYKAGVPLNEKRIEKIVEEGYEYIFVREEEELEEKEEEI